MLVVGLTGGIGSGKTTVARLFADKGIHIIDADVVAREVTIPGSAALNALTTKYGKKILLLDGSLDRASLKKIIFDNPNERRWVENLLHPLIRQEMQTQIQSSTSKYSIVVIPLLLETSPNPLINRVLVVDADENQQIDRAMLRDQVSREAVKNIIETQIQREQRLQSADDIIHNNGLIEDLIPQVDNLHEQYLRLAHNLG